MPINGRGVINHGSTLTLNPSNGRCGNLGPRDFELKQGLALNYSLNSLSGGYIGNCIGFRV